LTGNKTIFFATFANFKIFATATFPNQYAFYKIANKTIFFTRNCELKPIVDQLSAIGFGQFL